MPRPAVNIVTKDSPPPVALPSEASLFVVAATEKGPQDWTLSKTWAEWQDQHGGRTTNTLVAYDSVEDLFTEGAKRIYTSRVAGPAAVTASIAITESATTVFTVEARQGPGIHGNDLNVVIRGNGQDASIPAGSFRMRIQTDAAVILEESYDLLDKAAALYWMDTVSKYIRLKTDGANANDPTNGSTFALAGGVDDFGGIVDATWATALDKFVFDLGTGIVLAPARTTDTGHTQIKTHVEANNRVGYLDAPNTGVVATLTASAAACRSRFCGMFWPFVNIKGVTVGSYRSIAPSVIAAGVSARNDAAGLSPNKAAAGDLGISRTAVSLAFTAIDTDHQTLNAAGVNVIRKKFNQFKIMGWRTTVSEAADPKWVNLGNARLHRAIGNGAWLVGERYIFDEIDGGGLLLAEWQGALTGEVMMPYFVARSLYGATPEAAFRVDISGNTAVTAQNRQLIADLIYVASEFGEEITVNISKQLITEGVGQ